MPTAISDEKRSIIIRSVVEHAQTPKAVADVTGVKPDTIRKIVRDYLKDGKRKALPRGGSRPRKKALDEGDVAFIKEMIDENCAITLEDMRARLFTARNKTVSTSTIGRAIDGFHYTFKRLDLVAERANDPELVAQRVEFANEMRVMLHERARFFFIDETGFQISMRQFYGRSPVNMPARLEVPRLRSKNFTVVAAMSKTCLFHFTVLDGPCNGAIFLEYIGELIDYIKTQVLTHDGNESAYLIMDNASIHKTRDIRQRLEDEERVKIKFLPPYSPFFNPIENLFSKWKHLVRKAQPTCVSDLIQKINDAATKITQSDCENTYTHVEENYLKAAVGQPIRN